jgi:hypothetical protein
VEGREEGAGRREMGNKHRMGDLTTKRLSENAKNREKGEESGKEESVNLFLIPYSLFLIPYSLFLIP